MLSSLFRSKNARRQQADQRSPFSSPFSERTSLLNRSSRAANGRRRVAADFDDEEDDHDGVLDVNEDEDEEEEEDENVEGEDNDSDEGITPLLPLFEASHLGSSLCLLPTWCRS